jgi:hypothetical protein
MRALCGAVIAAGALIGLGLTAVGIGMRYAAYATHDYKAEVPFVEFKRLDTPLMLVLIAALIALAIGLGIAFLGLMYHHRHRHHELQQLLLQKHAKAGGEERIPV